MNQFGQIAIGIAASISLLFLCSCNDNTTAEAGAKCDALASHPHDPNRYAAGVPDEQFAPGAAVDACGVAVAAKPDSARYQFQLGRAYWIAQRDRNAFDAFRKAADLNYAPAMKYIGDAYNEGRGLPPGKQPSIDVAMAWYKKSRDGGFKDGEAAVQETQDILTRSTFNASLFQNPQYMSQLYEGNFEKVDKPIMFLAYVRGFSQELGGNNIFMVNPDCKGMVTDLSDLIHGFQQLVSYVNVLGQKNGVINALIQTGFSGLSSGQGERDATILMKTYKCDGPITKRIVANTIGSYQKLPAIINASLGGNAPAGGDRGESIFAPPEAKPLYEQAESLLYAGVMAGGCAFRDDDPACKKIRDLIRSKSYRVVRCIYGPFKRDGTGFRTYSFWRDKAPDNLASYTVSGDDHPFLILGTSVVKTCPQDSNAAQTIFQASRLPL